MRLSFGFLSAFLAIGLALCISAKADAQELASASPEGGEPLVLVCRLSGGDLPVSGLEYLSELDVPPGYGPFAKRGFFGDVAFCRCC